MLPSSPTTQVSFETIKVERLQLSRCRCSVEIHPHRSASTPSFQNISSKRAHICVKHTPTCTDAAVGEEPGRTDRQTPAKMKDGFWVLADLTVIWTPQTRQAVCMALDWKHTFSVSSFKVNKSHTIQELLEINYKSIYLERFQGTKPRTLLLGGASYNVSDCLHSLALKCCY